MPIPNITVSEVQVEAEPGADVRQALREAVILALTEWRPVRLSHNAKKYLIHPGTILDGLEPDASGGIRNKLEPDHHV